MKKKIDSKHITIDQGSLMKELEAESQPLAAPEDGSQPCLVFHLRDEALYERFIIGISRDDLLKPLRRSQDLSRKYFRGYRLSKHSPSLKALTAAYRKEICGSGNEQLQSFLCRSWVLAHRELSISGLRLLGIETDLQDVKTWLPRAHHILDSEGGHDAGAAKLTRCLTFDFEGEDIAIFVSTLSVGHPDQDKLKGLVLSTLAATADDPVARKSHVEEQLQQLDSVVSDLRKALKESVATNQQQLTLTRQELDATVRSSAALEQQLKNDASETAALEAQFQAISRQLQESTEHTTALDCQRIELIAAAVNLQTRSEALSTAGAVTERELNARLATTETQRHALRQELGSLQQRIAEREAAEAQIKSPDNPAGRPPTPIRLPASLSSTRWLNDVIDDVYAPSFSTSCITLELLRLKRAGLIPTLREEPAQELRSRPSEWQQAIAGYLLFSDNRWSRSALAQYAAVRCITATSDSDETLADVAISGLYHAGRVTDPLVTQRLIATLLAVVCGKRPVLADADSPDAVIDAVAGNVEDLEVTSLLGSAQAKLATANPRALLALYDALPQRPRLALKRALVSRLVGFGFNERDPTHELLDVVNSRVAAMVAPLSSLVRAIWRKGAITTLVGMREHSLRATKAMIGTFSADADHRLRHFHQLLGQNLTTAMREHSPDGYGRLIAATRGFVEAEIRNPEWISSRLLVPLALDLARCAMSADMEVRETLRAVLKVEADKVQQPLGDAPRHIEVGLTITNTGNAAGTDVELVVMPSDIAVQAADVQNPEAHFASLPIQSSHAAKLQVALKKPLPALELDYVISWQDPSHEKSESAGSVKLTAQRAVDWDLAGVNPYSLRSITQLDRLFGRESVIDRLRSGVLGLQSFYLTGQKRVGKSSVSRVLYRDLRTRPNFVSLYITLGELQSMSPQALMTSLQRALVDRTPEKLRERLYPAVIDAESRNEPSCTAFINACEKNAPDLRFLCIIDDFDELNEKLYRGLEAEMLFLQLRALIDRGFISFVFVGSERLPEILRYQGERLNQVSRHSLDYLSDAGDIARLVEQPAKDVLEFDTRAVDRIAYYSAGNPYYATQICMRVYEDLIARHDHYASLADIEHSVTSIADEESVSTFQHFWRDGIFVAADSEAERFQQLNALILLELARTSAEGAWTPQAAIEEAAEIRRYSPSEIQYRVSELSERQVLNSRDGRVQIRVPLFGKWLSESGSSAVRTSFGERQWELLTNPHRKGVTNAEIVAVAKNLVYQGEAVSDIRIKAWLEQFGDARNQELVYQLLRYVKEHGYYNDARLMPLFKKLHSLVIASQTEDGQWAQQVKKRKPTNLFVSCVDREGKSGSAMIYVYRNANQLPPHLTGGLDEAAAFLKAATGPCVLILVDDFIGSGGTFVEGINHLESALGGSLHDHRHTVYAVAAVGLRHGTEHVSSTTGVRCFLGEELVSNNRAFSPDSGIFSSDTDRRTAEALCRTIGEALEPKHPMGFADCQSLIVFEHRCPNNTLPFFCKTGKKYQGADWVPLFPRG